MHEYELRTIVAYVYVVAELGDELFDARARVVAQAEPQVIGLVALARHRRVAAAALVDHVVAAAALLLVAIR